MEVRRERSEIINIQKYNEIKKLMYINPDEYERECCFAREIIFGRQHKTLLTEFAKDREPKIRKEQIRTDDIAEDDELENVENLTFSLWLNRNNYDEIYLSGKYIVNGLINYSETRITRMQAMHIINGDTAYMERSGNLLMRQLALYIKYNQFQAICFREYFEEKYYSADNSKIVNFKSMELKIGSDIIEFFSEKLNPVTDLDYDRIEMDYIQKIELPAMMQA
ncbi:MAG: hypothetical protein IJA27_03430 [Lachnospiraceae bacterium]|nr:hypothetical protein [Lachnospiraceae bacterium]